MATLTLNTADSQKQYYLGIFYLSLLIHTAILLITVAGV